MASRVSGLPRLLPSVDTFDLWAGISILLIPLSFDFVNALCIATVLGFFCEQIDRLGRLWSAARRGKAINKVAVTGAMGKHETPLASGPPDAEAGAAKATAGDTSTGVADLEAATADGALLLRPKLLLPSCHSQHDMLQITSAPTTPRGERVRLMPRNTVLPPIEKKKLERTETPALRRGGPPSSRCVTSSPTGAREASSAGPPVAPVVVHWGLALVATMQLVLSVIRDHQTRDASDE